jgi:HD-GYP domain-containing protein (c-di-GMP phosphodiesterase class II)
MTAGTSTSQLNHPKFKRAQIRFPIRAKITMPYLLLAIVIAIGAAYVVIRIVFDTTEERFSNQLVETEKLSAEWLVREENRLLKSLRMLAFTEGMSDALEKNDIPRLTSLVTGVAAAQGEEQVIVLNPYGGMILGLFKNPASGNIDFVSSQQTTVNFAALPFVQQVLNGDLDSQGDKFSGLAYVNDGYVFYVSGPLRDAQERLVGVALVGKTLKTVVNQLREETLAQVSLYDTSGKLLATTLSEPQSMDPELADQLITGSETTSFKRTLNNERSFNILDLNYTELVGAWQVRNSNAVGLLGTSMINNYWVTASTPTRLQIGGLVLFLIILVFIVGVEIADRITYPLNTLVLASSQVANGNLNVRLPSGGNDEVAYLTETFNTMVANLNKSRQDLIQAYDETISGWATMLDQRDQDTEGHTRRVTELTLEVGRRFGLSEEELVHMRRGALLHDIGKMSVPDQILKKTGKLTPEEWVIMRLHPKVAYDVLHPIEYLRPSLDIPYTHHERWDGSGYPRGLRGEQIPLSARIFSVVDVWDAMTSDRPYRKAMKPQSVIDHIFEQSGKMFDPRVVQIFWEVITQTHPDLEHPGITLRETDIRVP